MGKLVRDRISEIIHARGGIADTRVLGATEYREELFRKLSEESYELAVANEADVAEELADVLEVLRALAAEHGLDWRLIERLRDSKRDERGGFEGRVYLVDWQRVARWRCAEHGA